MIVSVDLVRALELEYVSTSGSTNQISLKFEQSTRPKKNTSYLRFPLCNTSEIKSEEC